MNDARALYAQRLEERKRTIADLRGRERRISIARLVLIAAAIGIVFWKAAAALVPIALFIALVVVHERIITRRKHAESGAAFYDRGLGRIDGTWQGRGD